MKSRLAFLSALLALAACAIFSGCSTVSSRIEENRAAFEALSSQDQALVSQRKIRGHMTEEAVYIAWGRPQQKAVGEIHGVPTETWVYLISTAAGPYYGTYPGGFYGGYVGAVYGHRDGHRFYGAIYDPFYDPFYYPFAPTVTEPVKTVSFQRGRVIAFQYLTPAY